MYWSLLFNYGTGIWTSAQHLIQDAENRFGEQSDADVERNIKRAKTFKAQYKKTIALRHSLLSELAPYWYFLEHGNSEFEKSETGPYPVYGAPQAVTKAKRRAEDYINEKMIELANTYSKTYDKGWRERKDLIRTLERLVRDLTEIDVRQIAELLEEHIVRYHGFDTFQEMDGITIRRIVNEIVLGIRNKEFRVYDPGLPGSGKMRTLEIHKKLQLASVRRAQIALESIGT